MQRAIRSVLIMFFLIALGASCGSEKPLAAPAPSPPDASRPALAMPPRVWFGVHVPLKRPAAAEALRAELPALAEIGVNLLITEINYNFEFVSRPELRSATPLSAAGVKKLAAACRAHGIRLVPQFQCLGHQSWGTVTHPLLKLHPEFDETPGLYPGNKGLYARSWCPLHPDVNRVVFDLLDELMEVFETDALHVGLDEVFVLASPHCPRCRQKPPAAVFARAVNDLYGHVVKARGQEMMMWADRLIDPAAANHGKFESSFNGTHPAVDRIPKDIVLCDWHYDKRETYPSLDYFLKKGFRVLPTSYDTLPAVTAYIDYTRAVRNDRMLGHLATTWKSPVAGFSWNLPQIRTAAAALKIPHSSSRGE